MKIEHIAIYVEDLESMKQFYEKYFMAKSNEKYENTKKGFESYFLTFDEGSRLEIMRKIGVEHKSNGENLGYTHFAFSVGSKEKVDEITNRLIEDGYEKLDGPRITGDGYYESLFLDPEGNRLEITI